MAVERMLAGALRASLARQYEAEGYWRWDGPELEVRSASQPWKYYRMRPTAVGRWEHADPFACPGFLYWNHCRHEEEAERVAEMTQEIEVYRNPLALAQDVSVDDVISGFTAVGEWRYAFKQKGREIEGLSSDGVQDGVRQLARKGEAIRTLDVRLDHETEREAFFVARAGRYAIAPDGQEVLLDTTFRGKRVSKFEARADGSGDYYNDAWFEHGITKAARNAEEALMPEALKQWMIAQARTLSAPAPAPARPVQRPTPRPAPRQTALAGSGSSPTNEARKTEPHRHSPSFTDSGAFVCSSCGEVLDPRDFELP